MFVAEELNSSKNGVTGDLTFTNFENVDGVYKPST